MNKEKTSNEQNDENALKEQMLQEIEKLGTSLHTILTKETRMSTWENKLSTNQQLLLYLIWKREIKTVKELATELGVSPSAVSQMVAKLEKMKLVKRSIDLQDRRNICVELELEGQKVLEEADQVRALLLAKIELQDLIELKKGFEKFYHILVENYSKTEEKYNEKDSSNHL